MLFERGGAASPSAALGLLLALPGESVAAAKASMPALNTVRYSVVNGGDIKYDAQRSLRSRRSRTC